MVMISVGVYKIICEEAKTAISLRDVYTIITKHLGESFGLACKFKEYYFLYLPNSHRPSPWMFMLPFTFRGNVIYNGPPEGTTIVPESYFISHQERNTISLATSIECPCVKDGSLDRGQEDSFIKASRDYIDAIGNVTPCIEKLYFHFSSIYGLYNSFRDDLMRMKIIFLETLRFIVKRNTIYHARDEAKYKKEFLRQTKLLFVSYGLHIRKSVLKYNKRYKKTKALWAKVADIITSLKFTTASKSASSWNIWNKHVSESTLAATVASKYSSTDCNISYLSSVNSSHYAHLMQDKMVILKEVNTCIFPEMLIKMRIEDPSYVDAFVIAPKYLLYIDKIEKDEAEFSQARSYLLSSNFEAERKMWEKIASQSRKDAPGFVCPYEDLRGLVDGECANFMEGIEAFMNEIDDMVKSGKEHIRIGGDPESELSEQETLSLYRLHVSLLTEGTNTVVMMLPSPCFIVTYDGYIYIGIANTTLLFSARLQDFVEKKYTVSLEMHIIPLITSPSIFKEHVGITGVFYYFTMGNNICRFELSKMKACVIINRQRLVRFVSTCGIIAPHHMYAGQTEDGDVLLSTLCRKDIVLATLDVPIVSLITDNIHSLNTKRCLLLDKNSNLYAGAGYKTYPNKCVYTLVKDMPLMDGSPLLRIGKDEFMYPNRATASWGLFIMKMDNKNIEIKNYL